MQNNNNRIAVLLTLVIGMLALSVSIKAQLINEILVNPDFQDSNCEYVEIIGTPGGTLANIYFVSIDGDGTGAGAVREVVDLTVSSLGSNGLLVISQPLGGNCTRTYDSPTTTWVQQEDFSLQNGTNSWALIKSPTTAIEDGVDYDTNNDGTLDALPGDAEMLDSFGWSDGGNSDFVYGPELVLPVGGASGAATRFPNNTLPNIADVWYFGQMDGAVTSVMYDSNGVSSNFPQGGILTPGTANVADLVPTEESPMDFDGDSKTDISIFRPEAGQWWYLRSSDSDNRAFTFGINTDTPVPADFTGDGKTDVAFWRETTGEWFVLRSEDFSFYSVPFGSSGDIPAPADYDGDGAADTAVFRPSVGTWFINRSSDGNTDIVGFGASGDKPVVADYDGDGKEDIAIYRPSNSQWWIKHSFSGVVTAVQFGSAGDKTVQGDYTADGKADVAFWRPSTGQWFVIRSQDSSFFAFPFGTNGDIPTPGDYDGDGNLDVGVFRPSTNTWYLGVDQSGSRIFGFGANGDFPLPSAYVYE